MYLIGGQQLYTRNAVFQSLPVQHLRCGQCDHQSQQRHSSLKIEANSLSLGQVRDIIDGKTVLGEPKEIQEVKNAFAAYERFSEIEPYSIESLKQFHGIMTQYLVPDSGEFRRARA